MAVQLTREQAAVVADRGGELLVSAAAGSGKTFVLVQRLLDRVLREGMDLDQFLIITFTKAAAAELRSKIMAALREALEERPGDVHLKRQTTLIYRTQISTIHAFCTRLLRESSAQLDLDPDFRMAEDGEAGLLRSQTLDRVIEEAYAHLEEGHFASLVDTLSAGRDDNRLKTIVLDIHSRIQSHPDPACWLREQSEAFELEGVTDAAQTSWGALLLEDAREQVEYWRRQMVRALDLLAGDAALEQAYAENFCGTLDSMDAFLDAARQGWDAAAAQAGIRFDKLKAARKVEDIGLREQVKGLRDQCKKKMAQMAERFAGDSASLLGDLAAVREPVQELFRLVAAFEAAYQQAKRRRRMLDFNDLEHLTVRALVAADGSPTELARQWQGRFAEVLVDEYQDTNAVQNAIFNALTGGGKTLFQVGDVKQSIYRFRLADPGIFLDKFNRFPRGGQVAEGESRTLVLSRNFRSRPSVLEAVNFVFEQIMTPAFGEIAYTEDQRLYPGGTFPAYPGDVTELNVVDVSGLETGEDEASIPRDQAEAQFVARRVRRLLDEPGQVTEDGTLRPVRPEDIAILHRSPSKVLRHLTLALDREQVPWQLAGDEDFFSSTEVRVALAFLQVVDNPREDVPLIAVLRSPVCGFSGDQLALLRAGCPQGDFYTCLCRGAEQGDGACAAFLEELDGLRLLAPDLSAAQLLWHIYDRTGLMGIFGAMAGGQRRQDNLLAFYDYACACQRSGRSSLFDFVRNLRQMLEQGETLPGVPGRQGSGVHIMSIHKSKGLEFPVVILADCGKTFNRQDLSAPALLHGKLGFACRLRDQQRRLEYDTLPLAALRRKLGAELCSEELRMLYVALTRARERLILVGTVSTTQDKFCAKEVTDLEDGRLPAAAVRGGSTYLDWIVMALLHHPDGTALRELADCEEEFPASCPGHFRIFTGLEAECRTAEAAPEEELPPPDPALTEELRQEMDWQYPWQDATELSSKFAISHLAEEVGEVEKPRFAARPAYLYKQGLTPAEKGSAMHTYMQFCSYPAAARDADAELERLMEDRFLTEEQGAAIETDRIRTFFESPLYRRISAARQVWREYRFLAVIGEEELAGLADAGLGENRTTVQGVADCIFEEEDGIVIVDYKTDRVFSEEALRERYRVQLGLYGRLIGRALGRPVKECLLYSFALGRTIEVPF